MRTSLLAGGLTAVAAAVAVWLGDLFGLELDSFALLGVAVGAIVAIIPDRSIGFRLAGFVGGVAVTWVVFFIRAAMLPDTSGGRAVAAFLMLGLCVGIVAVSLGRIPLWSTLLGAAALFGVYEAAFAAAPPEVADTSVTAVTSLLITAAIGFLAASLVAPAPPAATREGARARRPEDHDRLDDMMEKSQ